MHRLEAERQLQEAIKLEPTNAVHQLNLAVIRLDSKDPQVVAAARAQLEALRAHPDYGIAALRSLAAHSLNQKDFATAERLSTEVLARTNSVFSDRISHLSILQEARRSELNDYLAASQKASSTNVANIYDLAAWMMAHEMVTPALTWLKSLPAETRSQQPLPLAIADGYIAQKDWQGLELWLREQKWGEQDSMRFALLSYALRNAGDAELARVNWNKATRAAEDHLDQLWRLARAADGWKWKPEVEGLLWQITQQFPQERWAWLALEKSCMEAGNTKGLLNVYSGMNRLEPADAMVKNNLATVSLLLNTETARAHQLAREAFDSKPGLGAFATTYAYSLHLQGRTSEALKILAALKDEELRKPSTAVYYVLLYWAAGEKEKADKYLALAGSGPFLPEEKLLLTQAQKAQ